MRLALRVLTSDDDAAASAASALLALVLRRHKDWSALLPPRLRSRLLLWIFSSGSP